ncbi:MAG: cell division protein FtsX, partial [Pseudomonadales bacterium]
VVEKTWLERVADISRVVNRLGVVLGVLFGIGAVLVTTTSVRLAIEARLDELRVLKLVGASDSQIRRPFLYFGALYGLGGGLVAAMLISLGLVVIETPLTNLLGSFDQDLQLAGFDPRFLAVLLGFGGILGVSGAILAARQRLRSLEI